jgi:hypothetical protein
MHTQREEVWVSGIKIRPLQEAAFVMITRDAHHPLRRNPPGLLKQQLARAHHTNMRALAGHVLVDVCAGHIKGRLCRAGPPGVLPRIVQQIGTLGIPSRAYTDLIGDSGAAVRDTPGSPLAAKRFKHPGLSWISYEKAIIIPARGVILGWHTGAKLTIVLHQRP